MAYYDALIAKWPSISGATTAAKLTNLNATTANGPAVAMVVPTYSIYNTIVPAEFVALTAANQQLIRDILSMGTVDASPGTSVRARVLAVFPSGTTTFTNLSALAAKYDAPQIPWWQANGYRNAINTGDAVVAGLDTTTGYSAQIGVPTSNQFNVTLSVVVTGPKTSETATTFATTLDANYAKFFAASCVQNMITRDASMGTFP